MMTLRRHRSLGPLLASLSLLAGGYALAGEALGAALPGPRDGPRNGPPTLRSLRPLCGAGFGAALAADQGRLVVGAPGKLDPGVEVFRWSGQAWAPLGVLRPGAAADRRDGFGASVAAQGDWIAVGLPRSPGAAGQPGAGAVEVFHGAPGSVHLPALVGSLSPGALAPGAGFGDVLAFGGCMGSVGPRWLAVAAPWAPQRSPDGSMTPLVGEVHLFGLHEGRWTHRHVVRSPDPAIAQGFGTSLAFVGRWLLVGAPGDGRSAPGAGRVYLVDPLAGQVLADVGSPTGPGDPLGVGGARFGSAIAAIDDGSAVVSAPGRGQALVASIRSGELVLTAPWSGPAVQGYGRSLAAGPGMVVVGAPLPGPGGELPFIEVLVRGQRGPGGEPTWVQARRATWRSGFESCPSTQRPHGLGSEFAASVCLAGAGIAVGAPEASGPGARCGMGAVRWLDATALFR